MRLRVETSADGKSQVSLSYSSYRYFLRKSAAIPKYSYIKEQMQRTNTDFLYLVDACLGEVENQTRSLEDAKRKSYFYQIYCY